jgi:hypothetical protein
MGRKLAEHSMRDKVDDALPLDRMLGYFVPPE